ncbi:MAG: DUF2865 domain-containing protein [Bradyrhizobiaceae bacterium]|uniref:DUF2865 domain-containing protein n=1 Tax=unclassified Afipia TaxID=2642050 RepID=UPI000467C571|nr:MULTISPECIES: DUF2865 domain-containing protein [unclassified Afipia]MAH72420.1 DUF2865 domain-containing protein [Afipia sp.]OUX58510.1 MAG: hypothetical protein CBB64_24735 [Afipia sp. TMED4]RTL79686.1 MAG: DUF2865 domain-containing protein [Bradyrhizobiaceae bacterium]HAO39966.1 DUF2865 domain-containing protein [Afipia sp.]HAP13377.1 DUF2865 domain-containing protein [Afipia sp.]
MPNSTFSRWTFATAALVSAALLTHGAMGQQGFPPPPAAQPGTANPICQRLVGQLSAIDGGGGDNAKADQIQRYVEAQSRQQAELERVQDQAKRQGCDSSGFFSLFSGQSAQCGPINTRIQQMRSNLDQITGNLERLRGGGFGGSERENQRRSVLMALAQNNCGPQYAAQLRNSGGGSFLDNLFGGNNNPGSAPMDNGAASGTYRTVCARSCDGFYFPISFATVPSRFADDERTCKALCPAADATLFTYRNPGEDMNQAVSISGQPYSQSPNAFKYRQAFDKSCSCKAVGQTWSDALKNIDDKAAAAQQGDIIVTDESSKKMSQPQKAAPASAQKKSGTVATPANAQPLPTGAPTETPPASGDKPIRSVGPTFIPAR